MPIALGLEGKHIVVTGGTGALGAAVVDGFVDAGAFCHLPVRGAASQGRPGVVLSGGIDLTDETSVRGFFDGLPSLWASVHVAGGWAGGPIDAISASDFRAQLELNTVTAFIACREAIRLMRGNQPVGGRIVNVSSRAVDVPAGGAVAYAASKAAVEALTRSLAAELKGEDILVNAVAPGTIDTAANRAAMPSVDPRAWVSPADIAHAIALLVAPANRVMSGAIIPVYGRS